MHYCVDGLVGWPLIDFDGLFDWWVGGGWMGGETN